MKNEAVKVSVIVLTYNHERYITQALDSILFQNVGFGYEILIGDDASTDQTANIILDYAARYPNTIHPFLRKENIGATKNLYNLLTQARGTYIANLEGDDFWTSADKLQTQVKWLDSHPGYIGCCHCCKVVNEAGCEIPKPKWICEKEVFRFRDFRGIYLPGHPSTWVYRNIYTEPRYDYSVIQKAHAIIADRTIAMILLAQGNFFLLRQSMSCYRSIQKSDGKNATSQIFVNHDNSKYVEYRLTLDLERYAKEELNMDADFSFFRRTLFLKSLIKLAMKPCKSRWQCVSNIVRAAKAAHENTMMETTT